jgi:hypothetical protein
VNCPCSTPQLTRHVTEFKPEKVKTSHETYLPTAQIQAPLKNVVCLFLITHIQKRKASPDCTTQNTVNYNTTQGHIQQCEWGGTREWGCMPKWEGEGDKQTVAYFICPCFVLYLQCTNRNKINSLNRRLKLWQNLNHMTSRDMLVGGLSWASPSGK